VLFDSIETTPFVRPFSDGQLCVIAPLSRAATTTLRVRRGRALSNERRFRVARPRWRKRPTGTSTRELFTAVEQAAALTISLANGVAPGHPNEAAIVAAAQALEGARRTSQRLVEVTLDWIPLQANFPVEALRAIERIDELIDRGQLTAHLNGLVDFAFAARPSILPGAVGTSAVVSDLISRASFDTLTDFLSAVESIIKSVSVSLESEFGGGISALLQVEFAVGGDVEFNPGEFISGIAGIIGVIIDLIFPEPDIPELIASVRRDVARAREEIQRLEAKSDLSASDIARVKSDLSSVSRGVDRIEIKDDGLSAAVTGVSATLVVIEAKMDVGSGMLTTATEGIARIEEKGDRHGETQDIIQANQQRHEEKADRLEEQTTRLEEKSDRQEQKLDRLEQKGDRQEQKLDRLETKADRDSLKLDRLELKADQLGSKVDRVEEKADRQETKLDRLEQKSDRQEQKLDRQEEKLDRLEPAPQEGSIANQRGGAPRVTAAVASVSGNDVYLRAAVNKLRTQLDELGSWSPWVNFGRPPLSSTLRDVSIDLQYEDGSNSRLNALVSARDGNGRIFSRSFRSQDHFDLLDPSEWNDWQTFLGQP
jgi:hypothetical protein